MKKFSQFIQEEIGNTTALFSYGRDFQVDVVTGDWDVEDFEDGKKMKPWEVENADYANKRRNDIIRWAKSGFLGLPEVITDKSIPLTPKWQSRKR